MCENCQSECRVPNEVRLKQMLYLPRTITCRRLTYQPIRSRPVHVTMQSRSYAALMQNAI